MEIEALYFPFSKNEKQKLVENALAIGDLGGIEVTPEDMKLFQKFINGELDHEGLLIKALEKYTVKTK